MSLGEKDSRISKRWVIGGQEEEVQERSRVGWKVGRLNIHKVHMKLS